MRSEETPEISSDGMAENGQAEVYAVPVGGEEINILLTDKKTAADIQQIALLVSPRPSLYKAHLFQVIDIGASYKTICRHLAQESLMKEEARKRGVGFLPRQVMRPIYKKHNVW